MQLGAIGNMTSSTMKRLQIKNPRSNKIRPLMQGCFTLVLAASLFLQGTVPVYATIDYKAEAEARKNLPVQTNQIENWPDGPAIGAEGAILMEASTGTILYAKNIDEKLYPASTTKILTALIAAENSDMNEDVTFSHDAVFSIERGSSNMGMDAGEVITMEQALYGLLVNSANESANAIAEHISGSMEAFADKMNETAARLGCKNSHFVTTNGLHDDNHYTTPYDLALIARAFFSNELLCKMSSTKSYYIPQSPTQPDDDLYLNTHNQFLTTSRFAYEYYLGGKTGFTSVARQTLVSAAQKDGMRLICVIMKEESPDQFQDTLDLFQYGFDNFQLLNVSENEAAYKVDNSDFFTTDNDIFGNSKPILSMNTQDSIVLPKTAEFSDAESELTYDNISDDSAVATISYSYHGVPIGTATIDLAMDEQAAYDFETPALVNEKEPVAKAPEEKVFFINVKRVIFWILGIAGVLILLILLLAFFNSYHFSERRRRRRRRSVITKKRVRPARARSRKKKKKRPSIYYYD